MSQHNQKSNVASTASESPDKNMDPGGGGEGQKAPGSGSGAHMDPGGGGER